MTNAYTNSPPRSAGLLTVELGVELKKAWVQWCDQRELGPGKTLRNLAEQAIAGDLAITDDQTGPAVHVAVGKEPDRGPKLRRELQLTPTEGAAIETAAKAQGFGFQDWVIAAVRAALAQAPTYGQVELETLTQSNAHMAQIAIELAVLRRQETDGVHAERLAQLERDIRQHVEDVSTAMAKGAQRWQLKICG